MTPQKVRASATALFLLALGIFSSCIHFNPASSSNEKLSQLLHIINHQYVDTVNVDELVEKTIPKVLAELDPHSVYIPAKDAEESNQELKGSFSGIGIQFMIQSDTIYVSDVISGGPAEKVGLMAGDRIVTIDDSLYVGKKINNDGAMKRLKGPKGSEVKLGIRRYGEKELIHYNIVRGNIPVKSVDASYMINNHWCYIKANKFGETKLTVSFTEDSAFSDLQPHINKIRRIINTKQKSVIISRINICKIC